MEVISADLVFGTNSGLFGETCKRRGTLDILKFVEVCTEDSIDECELNSTAFGAVSMGNKAMSVCGVDHSPVKITATDQS